jgi:hypothetical protein
MPAAQVNDSKPAPLKLVTPPNPFQRPTGTSTSNPISSPMRASSSVLGQSASSTPSTVEIAQPPLRLLEKVPSFSLRSLNNGLLASRNCSARVMAMSVSCPFVSVS